MPASLTVAPRLAAALLVGVLVPLLLAGLLARSAAEGLVSPLPGPLVVAGAISWVGVGLVLGWLVVCLPLPRLVGRLLVPVVLGTSGWSMGTLARGLFVSAAFLLDGAASPVTATFQAVPNGGPGARDVVMHNFQLNRTVSVPMDADAVDATGRGFVCLDLTIERTAHGVARLRRPTRAYGVDDFDPCGP